MEWRVIPQQNFSAAMNMAVDESIYESVSSSAQPPTIRFYKWQPGSISLGAQQNHKEINFEACVKHDVPVVRRMTGGAAVYHDKNDFTYSVIAPVKSLGNNIHSAYREVCSWIINALKQLGIPAQLKNKNDIVVYGRKISGNAAMLMKGVYLQHGTIIYDVDYEVMPKVLNVKKELIRNNVTSISEHSQVNKNRVYYSMLKNFTSGKNFRMQELSAVETARARQLVKDRYGDFLSSENSRNKGACYVVS